MQTPFEFMIGLTYTRRGRRGRRRDGFMSFISGISVASIALGVAALIIVLSVMNGFQKEVRDRMLSVIPHIEVTAIPGPLADADALAAKLEARDDVLAAAPYVQGQGLFSSGSVVRGALVKGIDPAKEPGVSEIAQNITGGAVLSDLTPKSFGVILGRDLARSLGVRTGDRIALLVPQGSMTPAGLVPRMRQLTVIGYLASGHYEYDSTMALLNIEDAAAIFRTGGPQGLRLRTADMYDAPYIATSIAQTLDPGVYAADWSRQNRTWFAAVQVEKRMMGIILFLIVLVGAFGLVSTLVMTVKEKQSDIAILRTLGASRGSILAIFMIQGTIVGAVGVASGVAAGLLISYNVGEIVSFIESLMGVEFLPREIYFISNMPSDPRLSDIFPISVFSFLLSLAATLYPSWRAARIHPAEALRYE
ncbi:lipoprotein-releasing ABC transporter permease subunit [Sutterella sp.]|uniref:lipoprotein-releasing ABC transporter permease subunit n=1 Tax=Sutterella sp. TaxID=1981025 RepID=UPI0026E04F1A|nr:lipoprotein-releasing ABC transporter permease subunit [Sutterella sp.]MDO5530528.1 lipoprotein-releasing ABC transporter permease subunit [Sutterella sp.]